jgi:hypothetical protein
MVSHRNRLDAGRLFPPPLINAIQAKDPDLAGNELGRAMAVWLNQARKYVNSY